jgi:PPOX class probable FMN-dependent enzyme
MSETLAPWRSLIARALHRNRSLADSRYAQLATVRSDGQPANRTIVFRGFVDEVLPESANSLKFITDIRSEKINEIAYQAWGELCWYFPKTREQFRILGQLQVVDSTIESTALQKLRRMTWHNLSDAARSQFAWPTPKQPLAEATAFKPQELSPNHPIENFGLLLLNPTNVDHLELRGEPQNRCLYELQDDWQMRSVNP